MDKNKCSSCGEASHKCSCKNKDFTKAVIEIDNPEQITLMRKVVIPASMGDDTTVPPVVGKYHNVLLYYEANSKSYLYSSDGVPTQLVNGVTDYEAAVNLPQINGVTLLGDKSSADLKLADAPMVITVASDNTSWSGADTAEEVYNFFLNKGKVNIVFNGGETYAYEIDSAGYIPEEEKMMCTLTVATITTSGETAEFDGNALVGTMTLYTADKAIDVSQIELQPKLYITDFTGLDLNYNELSGVPATNAAIGMVKPGDGLEIASDGTLSISDIEQYAHFFDTVADMKAATNLVAGDYARTLGYYSANDGGGALYKIENSPSTRYHMEISSNLYATIIDTNINVDQLGANGGNHPLSYYFATLEDAQKVYPNATSLTELIGGVAIQCTMDYFHDNKIELNANTYYISSGLSTATNNRVHLCGNVKWKSIIRKIGVEESENTILILGNSSSRNVIENIDFVGPDEPTDTTQATLESYKTNGILLNSSSYNQIRNCVFRQLRSGIKTTYSWTNLFIDCYFARCNMGVGLEGSAQNCTEINHCFAEYCNYGLYLGEGRSQLIINCNVEHCNVKGIRKTNEGDIQILSSYFESDLEIFYGQTYTRNVLISGCSFYQNSTDNAFYTPIVFSGNASGNTQVTIQNCNFVDANSEADYSDHPAIMQLNNATTIPPVLINNTVTNMIEFRPTYMRGIHIKNGILENYFHRTYYQNIINCSDGGVTTLTLTGGLDHRINLMDSGTHSIKFPSVDASDRYVNHTFTFVVPSNNSSTRLGTVSLIPNDSTTCEVAGHTTISISDKNKLITATYVGNYSSKDHWAVSVSA